MDAFYEFEKPIVSLEKKLQDLRELAKQEGVDFSEEISILEQKVSKMIDEIYAHLSPWQRVQLSRHPNRPYTKDYIDMIFPTFMELHGDRCFADDQAMLTGVATWPPATPQIQDKEKSCESNDLDKGKTPIMIIGQQKGRSSKQKMERNFGMSRPEGYRKAMRMMLMAERAKMPVLTFIDTPGAFPGADAEQRGQAQAIAESINLMAGLKVPTMAVVIGEGGSGGALAIGIGNKVLMQEYSFYSVISPESCASILWSDSSLAERASEKLRMWPQELLRFGTIDDIIPEPKGGAHRNWEQAALLLRENLIKHLSPLIGKGAQSIVKNRLTKFRSMGIKALETTKPAESNQ